MLPFPREIGLKRTKCKSYEDFINYINTLNGLSSCYTSLYSFTKRRDDKPWRYDYTSAIIDKAWWDFDTSDNYDIEHVKQDVAKLIRRLVGDVRLVATGRGFHVYQYFKRSVTGKEWRQHLIRYQRKMASGLLSLDGVGLPEKLVRIPRTFNTTRGKWATPIDSRLFADDPLSYSIGNHPMNVHHCPFLGIPVAQERFDLVLWSHDNPIQNTPVCGGSVAMVDAPTFRDGNNLPLPPCISDMVYKDNPPHFARLALVQYLSEELRWFSDPSTVSEDQWESVENYIFSYIKDLKWRDFNEQRTRIGIRTNMKYKQSPTCRAFNGRNMCPQKCWKYDGSF